MLIKSLFLASTMVFHFSVLSCFASLSRASFDRQVSVTGQCTRLATPDRAEINVVADFQDKDYKVAVREANRAYEQTRDAVKKLGLPDLEVETSEYNIHEVKEWEKDRQVLKGYQARIGLKVSTSNASQLGRVIEIATQHDVKDIGQLRMFLSNEKLADEKAACLKTAAENARSKAKELAGALGARIGKVISIREDNVRTGPIHPIPGAMMMARENVAKQMEPPSQLEGGKQQISVQVETSFLLE